LDTKRIEKILAEKYSIHASLRPLKGSEDKKTSEGWSILGFDTEYNTRTDTNISYQLYADEKHYALMPGPKKLSLGDIVKKGFELCSRRGNGYRGRLLFVSYFNTAEYSQLALPFWEEEGVNFHQVHPSGIFHINGSRRYDLSNGDFVNVEFSFFDLWHFFASSSDSRLYSIAEKFGLKKLEYDVTNLSLVNLDDPLFRDYAINDAKLCVEIFNKLDEVYRRVNSVSIISRPTPANAAQASFKLNYLKNEVKAPNKYIRKLALRTDWAGRVECGFVGSIANVHEFDADSLYPRATLLLPGLPNPKDWTIGVPNSVDKIEGFIEFDFEFPVDEEWPCLPVYNNGRLYFPLKGTTSCTIGELRVAASRGVRIGKIRGCCYYLEGRHKEFHDFITDQLTLKESAGSNEALRAVAKLNSNSGIGKFVQNKGGMDYESALKYIEEQHIPSYLAPLLLANALRYEGHNFRQDVRIGASFYPEWHSLILGKAREVMANAIFDSPVYPKIIMVSTDSLHVCEPEMGYTMVRFNHKLGPCFFKAIRGRVHISTDQSGKVLKLAKHGMPIPNNEAADMILTATGTEEHEVQVQGIKTMRESILAGTYFGAPKTRSLKISMKPDGKRRLDDSGWSHPLTQVVM
jgi:hypothetical protein